MRVQHGDNTININPMRTSTDSTEELKDLSVRKLVRVIHEHLDKSEEGTIKKKVTRNYTKGVVRCD
eukprot:654385-Karenia_brevis.AAC.1